MTHFTTAVAAIVAATLLAPAAMAETPPRLVHVPVSTAGLDLNSPRDADILLQRIREAANQTCKKNWESVVQNSQAQCRKQVVADNVARLNINALGVAFVDNYGQQPALASRD